MMKHLFICLLTLSCLNSQAQISEGSIAPDFTFIDINGQPQHLYGILNTNKFVFLEISYTWCSPCWYLHDSIHYLSQVYNAFDVSGSNTGRVAFIESDTNTTLSNLQGIGSNTLGDWISGTNYTIINPGGTPQVGESNFINFQNEYIVAGAPLLLMICPNKKVYYDTLNVFDIKSKPWPPSLSTITWLSNTKCNLPSGLDEWNDEHPLTMYPNPSQDQVNVYFHLNQQATVTMQLINACGQVVQHARYDHLAPGEHRIQLPTNSLANGLYTLKVSSGTRQVSSRCNILH